MKTRTVGLVGGEDFSEFLAVVEQNKKNEILKKL